MGVDFSWQPIFLLSGNLPVVRAFFGSFPKDWLVPKYAHLIQAILARNMAKKGHKQVWWNRVEQGKAHPAWCIGTIAL